MKANVLSAGFRFAAVSFSDCFGVTRRIDEARNCGCGQGRFVPRERCCYYSSLKLLLALVLLLQFLLTSGRSAEASATAGRRSTRSLPPHPLSSPGSDPHTKIARTRVLAAAR